RCRRGAAGDHRQRPVEGRLAGLRPRERVHRCLDEPPGLVALQERGNGADDDRAAAELLEGEAELFEGRPPALEYGPCAGPEVERLGEEQRLRGGFPRVEDRKSTRLHSSHEWISYAVFCLKRQR